MNSTENPWPKSRIIKLMKKSEAKTRQGFLDIINSVEEFSTSGFKPLHKITKSALGGWLSLNRRPAPPAERMLDLLASKLNFYD